jgi:hypothetical protein
MVREITILPVGKKTFFLRSINRTVRCDLDMGRKWWSKRSSLLQNDDFDVFLAPFVEFGQSPQFWTKTFSGVRSNRRNLLLGDFSGKVA